MTSWNVHGRIIKSPIFYTVNATAFHHHATQWRVPHVVLNLAPGSILYRKGDRFSAPVTFRRQGRIYPATPAWNSLHDEIRRILLTVFVVTCKLFGSRSTAYTAHRGFAIMRYTTPLSTYRRRFTPSWSPINCTSWRRRGKVHLS